MVSQESFRASWYRDEPKARIQVERFNALKFRR